MTTMRPTTSAPSGAVPALLAAVARLARNRTALDDVTAVAVFRRTEDAP